MDYRYLQLAHVSPSQIKTFDLCPRKHWLEKIGGLPVPTNAGAEFGTRGHAAVEQRILTQAWPDGDPEAVRVAMAGWRFVPQEGPLLVEQEMRLEGAKLPIIGRIDLIAPQQSVVIDHKFMSSLRWIKTPEELKRDPQAVIYCTWAWRQRHLRVSSLAFRHIVYQTKGRPDAKTVQCKFLPGELEAAYTQIESKVAQIAANARERDPSRVRGAMESHDSSPCKAYDGCPHQSHCKGILGRSVWSGIADKDKEEPVNVMELLAKKKQAQGLTDVGAVNPPDGSKAEAAAPPTPAPAPAPQGDLFGLQKADAFPPDDPTTEYLPQVQTKDSSKINDPFALPTLYVGCLPCNENFMLLDQWLAPLMSEAAQTCGVDYYAQAEYGKGKTALAALIVHKVKASGIPPVLVVDPRLPASDVALEILRPLYQRIVMKIG